VPVTTPAQVAAAVERGRLLQKTWARTSFAERRRVLSMLKAAVLAQQDDIVRISCIDTGKPRVDAQFGEILSTLGKLDWVISRGEEVLRPEPRATNFTSAHKRAQVEYHPLGVIGASPPWGEVASAAAVLGACPLPVVARRCTRRPTFFIVVTIAGVIAPWNYPFYNMYNHVASALFAGNALVIKMSEYSAWSGRKYIEVGRAVLAAAGHDPDLLQLVNGFGETGAALVSSVDKLIFTGSPGIGKLVMKGAAAVSSVVPRAGPPPTRFRSCT
jgi:acyl-CoA reductase-like NAD-dependent aldehyde dehydrogenase